MGPRERLGDESPTWGTGQAGAAGGNSARQGRRRKPKPVRAWRDTRTPLTTHAAALPTRGRPPPAPSAILTDPEEPGHEDGGGLSAGGQRVGHRGCLQSDHRRPAGGRCAQRSAATCAPGRAAQGQTPADRREEYRPMPATARKPTSGNEGGGRSMAAWAHRSGNTTDKGRDGRNPYAARGTRTRAMPVKLRRGT